MSLCIACAEHRWPAKRGRPKLSDFREDTFLAPSPEMGRYYLHLVRTICQRDADFDPDFLLLGNSLESLLSMVAAGRGVLLLPDIALAYRPAGVNFHVLDDSKAEFEMFLLRRKGPEPMTTVDNFVKLLAESVLRLGTRRLTA
jgi:DNA-binding transcriptional LysR family regulator